VNYVRLAHVRVGGKGVSVASTFESDGVTRVVVVDEDPSTVASLVNALSCCGYEVEGAQAPSEALRILERNPARLLVTALHMTEMDGDKLFGYAQRRDPDIAVLLLISQHHDTQRAVDCLKKGADDFLRKPFELIEAAVRARSILEHRQLKLQNRALMDAAARNQIDPSPVAAGMAQDALAAFISALESKDEFTRDHSSRVSELSARIAIQMKPREISFQTEVRLGGLLHDIGKIGIRETVINKPAALTPNEFAEVQRHPVIGETILKPVVANAGVLTIVRNHHERWDGGGYPDGIAGQSISLGARIVAVADSFDAMTSARPYRIGMSQERAVEILREGANTQWDRSVVNAFVTLVAAGQLPERSRHNTNRREKALPTASDIVLPTEQFLRNAA